jgi:hypothetical protein
LTTGRPGSQSQAQGIFIINPRGNTFPAGKGVRLRISRSIIMDMSQALPFIYEAFIEAGIDPPKARKIERAIQTEVAISQSKVEKEILDRVMTKEDGLQLEQRLEHKIDSIRSDVLSAQNSQMKWYVSLMFVAVAAATAGVALIQKLA